MQTPRLGNSNLEVSAVGLGCMGLTFSYGTRPDHNGMIALLRVNSISPGIIATPMAQHEMASPIIAGYQR